MRASLAAAKDKSNLALQIEATNAIKEAKNALAFRKAAEKMSLIKLEEAYQNLMAGKHDVTDDELVPPELRNRTTAPEDEIEGNPLNCCKKYCIACLTACLAGFWHKYRDLKERDFLRQKKVVFWCSKNAK